MDDVADNVVDDAITLPETTPGIHKRPCKKDCEERQDVSIMSDGEQIQYS